MLESLGMHVMAESLLGVHCLEKPKPKLLNPKLLNPCCGWWFERPVKGCPKTQKKQNLIPYIKNQLPNRSNKAQNHLRPITAEWNPINLRLHGLFWVLKGAKPWTLRCYRALFRLKGAHLRRHRQDFLRYLEVASSVWHYLRRTAEGLGLGFWV